ncbi:MAG TPA: porphobilinogen synthase [Thermoplasmata archaeon]|nr:porphobilinogen synthase [Thermoplasmata archaeon]
MPGPRSAAPDAPTRGAPPTRLRRLRRTAALRDWVAETELETRRLVYPIFVRPGRGEPEPIASMPGVDRYPVEHLARLVPRLEEDGIRSVLLFGVARRKDPEGREAWAPDGIVPDAVRAIRRAATSLVVATDVCLCAYTSHGHCGVVRDGAVANDATCERLARVAVAHANAGADVVAPSAMMDGQVRAIRAALDRAGHDATAILAYAAKRASAFYQPFREAEGSSPAFGDRRSYQLDGRNAREALLEMELDAAEGADLLMVKPALPNLDLLARARRRFALPLAAYQVSGEYAMLKAAAAAGVVDERAAVEETLIAIRRAGADLIVTYFARDVARWLRERP